MKKVIKKWWFWTIIVILIITIVIAKEYKEQKDLEEAMKRIGESASDFYEGIGNAKSHINEFTYNYETGQVEYKPEKITLDMYNKIEKGMAEEEVVGILGNGEKSNPEESNSYLITWGDLNLNTPPYYRIQIIFDKKTKTVISYSQLGLE